MHPTYRGEKKMAEKKRILIVEDEIEFAKMVGLRLRSAGYQVALAGDTQIGTRKLMEEDWDLLVLDLMMPGGGGFALLDAVQKDPLKAQIPVIILTGKTVDEGVRLKAETYNVSDIIMKPYESKVFIEKIKTLVPN